MDGHRRHVALVRAPRSRTVAGTALTVGLVLVAAAVAKLFLFDLAALDGVFRVIVFIVTGLMILTLGSVYAKSLTDDRHQPAQ